MPRRRRFSGNAKRALDWTGVQFNATVTSLSSIENINLWTPVVLDKQATIIRIVGDIHIFPNNSVLDNPVEVEFSVTSGIQVVNRAAGTSGAARDPQLTDDLEGGEWMYLRQYCFQVTSHGTAGSVDVHALSPDLVGANGSHIDIRVKRKMDLSQDELLLTVSGFGAGLDVKICGMLRMLWMST